MYIHWLLHHFRHLKINSTKYQRAVRSTTLEMSKQFKRTRHELDIQTASQFA